MSDELTRRRATSRVLVGLLLMIAWAVAFPPWPDDWDGLGFLASIHRFDLAAFSPHPPGYPVYVGLLKLAALFTSTPIGAARLVGVLSGVVTFAALSEVSLVGAAAVCAVPLVFHAFSGVGSEGPALAFAAIAVVSLLRRWPVWLVGLSVGLGLGVRLSWAPVYLPLILLLPSRDRMRALLAASLACLAWAVPLVVLTGPSQLALLARTHVAGHMTVWGGTALTEPARLPFLLRDLFVDGFGVGTRPLGLVVLATLTFVTVASLLQWLRATAPADRRTHVMCALLLVLPYLAWVTSGQNLRQQSRHVVPLVALLAWTLGRAFASLRKASGHDHRLPPPGPPPRKQGGGPGGGSLDGNGRARDQSYFAFVVLAAACGATSAGDAVARKLVPPPGVQLLGYLRAHEASLPPDTTAVFAGASGRFFDGTERQSHVHPAATLGDATLAVAHLDRLPQHVLVTSELRDLDAGGRLALLATFCRPDRVDRRLPCLQVYTVDEKAALPR